MRRPIESGRTRVSVESLHADDNGYLHFVNTIVIATVIYMRRNKYVRRWICWSHHAIKWTMVELSFTASNAVSICKSRVSSKLYTIHTSHVSSKGCILTKLRTVADLLANLSLSQLTKCDWLIQIIRTVHTNGVLCIALCVAFGAASNSQQWVDWMCCVTFSTNRTLSGTIRYKMPDRFSQFVTLIGTDGHTFFFFWIPNT